MERRGDDWRDGINGFHFVVIRATLEQEIVPVFLFCESSFLIAAKIFILLAFFAF
jgi:hypothetical protein